MSIQTREWANRLDVVLKLAERCNLACPYCYYFFQENDLAEKSASALIPESTVREVAAFLRAGAEALDIGHLYIGLHGGEPLLLPKKRFDALCTILREELGDVAQVHLGLQTNGTLVDDEWIDLFAKHEVMVGVSIDGPPHVHDAGRPDHRGRGSYEAAVRGLRRLQDAHAAGRVPPTGVLCVANPEHDGGEIARHFVEELGVYNFDLLLPREGYDSEVWKPQSKWIRYFREVIRYWQTSKTERPVVIYLLSEILTALSSPASAQRADYRLSNRHSIITISSEGVLSVDDNIMALDKVLCNPDLTIRNTTLAEFVASPVWQHLVRSVDTAPEACARCEWYRSCRSGALFNRYKKGEGFGRRSVFCETLDAIHTSLAHMVAQREERIERMAEILQTPPMHWARDFLTSNAEPSSDPDAWLGQSGPVRLPIYKS
ncbi:radical SAM protein [Haliangium ochraceum]|uniref:Radical SAM domain protein n=1 Tax=Haliangium ochraceum (strain DSM 14365 / JCM 11303 / SMP-2) TaxID=502025 RepID=D0LR06_HALO1|nr:radical SAM protein [Haliangium ochraceum]ACY15514.1 Radical SAM domain protein [Haliangium ochraceum DSM 14365]